jgi:endonuclease G
MKIVTTIIALLLSTTIYANPIDDMCPEHVHPAGAPVSAITESQYVCHLNYAVHFRFDTKTAEYVSYHINPEDITGTAKRKDNFKDDPTIPDEHDVTLADYAGKPYDRGHLSAAADNSASEEQMSQSFYLSNMVPQNPNQNRGAWRILEDRIRNLAKTGMDLYVTVGTVYNPGYEVIGNELGVPQYIWKVVVDTNSNTAVAFLFPNEPVRTQDISATVTTIENIEKMTKLNFHPKLTDASHLESTGIDTTVWTLLQ